MNHNPEIWASWGQNQLDKSRGLGNLHGTRTREWTHSLQAASIQQRYGAHARVYLRVFDHHPACQPAPLGGVRVNCGQGYGLLVLLPSSINNEQNASITRETHSM